MAGEPNELELATVMFPAEPPKSKTAAAKILGCSERALTKALYEILNSQASSATIDIRLSHTTLGRPLDNGPELIYPEGLHHTSSRPVLRAK